MKTPVVLVFGLMAGVVALAQDAKVGKKSSAVAAISLEGNTSATSAADGGLRPVVGVHNIQVVRGNRTVSPHADGLTHTYLHMPMLAFWKGMFWLEYISAPRDEEESGCVPSLMWSADGVSWNKPRVVFPSYALPDGRQTTVLIRAGFYVARAKAGDDGRLLVMGFHGKPKTSVGADDEVAGPGIGRVVREVFCDEKGGVSFGPIYFLRYNRRKDGALWDESNTPYSLYKKSGDSGFVAACDALLADRLIVKQWEEEDPFATSVAKDSLGKATSFAHRPDGSVVAVYKYARANESRDEGRAWSRMMRVPNLPSNGSKYWIQRMGDGKYALVFSPTERLRQPLAVATSEDGRKFGAGGLLVIHGETPEMRFDGADKDLGPQYVRGIVEGNGVAPDGKLWLTYSVNKEDIWVARVSVPICGSKDAGDKGIWENFDDLPVGVMPEMWNVYCPSWASVKVVDAGGRGIGAGNHALELRDEEPYDYARATRVFPETHGVRVSLRVMARQTNARLEIELETASGGRPVRMVFGEDGHIRCSAAGVWKDAGLYSAGEWRTISLEIPRDPERDHAKVRIDGKVMFRESPAFAEPARTVERLTLRTGAYRNRGYGGIDLAGADEKAVEAVFLIDDVEIVPASGK